MACTVDLSTAVRMLLFVTARDMLSAATRLSLIGPMQAAQALAGLTAFIETLLASTTSTGNSSTTGTTSSGSSASSSSSSALFEQDSEQLTDSVHSSHSSDVVEQSSSNSSSSGSNCRSSAAVVWQVDPIQEILQGSHEKLYSRLFNS
jgi:urease accessory protein UreF